jgi:hypothetical protein
VAEKVLSAVIKTQGDAAGQVGTLHPVEMNGGDHARKELHLPGRSAVRRKQSGIAYEPRRMFADGAQSDWRPQTGLNQPDLPGMGRFGGARFFHR